jgi:hypothetical protein
MSSVGLSIRGQKPGNGGVEALGFNIDCPAVLEEPMPNTDELAVKSLSIIKENSVRRRAHIIIFMANSSEPFYVWTLGIVSPWIKYCVHFHKNICVRPLILMYVWSAID